VMLVGDPGLLPRLVPLGTGVDPLPRGRPAPRMIISTFSGITLAYALAPRCLASSAMPPGRKERESNPQGPKAHPFSRRDTTPMAALPRMTPAGVEPAELARLSSPYVGTRRTCGTAPGRRFDRCMGRSDRKRRCLCHSLTLQPWIATHTDGASYVEGRWSPVLTRVTGINAALSDT